MLPSLVAYMWRGVETATPLAPMILAHLIYFAIPVTVFLGLTRFNYVFPAIVALCVFALDTKFIEIARSQYSDTLLAFFILIAFVMYKEAQQGIDRRLFFLLGFIAGSTTWVKSDVLVRGTLLLFQKLQNDPALRGGCVDPVSYPDPL